MKVTQVVVGIHEKRNHPHEYGHYDASVTLTAEMDPEDDHAESTVELRAAARWQVLEECDEWTERVKEERRIIDLKATFAHQLRDLHWDTERRVTRCEEIIEELPPQMRAEYREKLDKAIAKLPPKEEPEESHCPDFEEEPHYPDFEDELAF